MRGISSRYARFEQSLPHITLGNLNKGPCAPSGGEPSGEWAYPKLVLSDDVGREVVARRGESRPAGRAPVCLSDFRNDDR
jgi:hypothetical protein